MQPQRWADIKLTHFPDHTLWAFTYRGLVVTIDGATIFDKREHAVSALCEMYGHLLVDAEGHVYETYALELRPPTSDDSQFARDNCTAIIYTAGGKKNGGF